MEFNIGYNMPIDQQIWSWFINIENYDLVFKGKSFRFCISKEYDMNK